MKNSWKYWISATLLCLVFFALPFEHKYDKVFRFYSLTLIPEGLYLPKSFDKKIYFYPSDCIAIVLFMIGLISSKGRFFQRGALFLGLIFVGAIVSIVASPFQHYPLAYIRLWQLFTPMALYLFLANGPLSQKSGIHIVSWSLFASSLIQSVWGIAQYFKQHAFGLRLLSEVHLESKIPSCPSGKLFLFDQIASTHGGIYRSIGTFSHPNVLGGFLALTLLITLYLFFIHPRWKWGLGGAYMVQLLALATTYSRSAIYAWGLSTLFFLIWTRYRQKISVRSASFLVLLSLGIVGSLFHEQYVYRGGVVSYTECNRGSDGERLHYQRVALRMMEQNLWFGVGFGRFSLDSSPFLDPHADPKLAQGGVHNIYMRIASEMGIGTLALFLSWIFLLLWGASRAVPTIELGWLLGAFLGILFIGGCDHYPILFQQGKLMLFSIAGLLARGASFEKKVSLQRVHSYDG